MNAFSADTDFIFITGRIAAAVVALKANAVDADFSGLTAGIASIPINAVRCNLHLIHAAFRLGKTFSFFADLIFEAFGITNIHANTVLADFSIRTCGIANIRINAFPIFADLPIGTCGIALVHANAVLTDLACAAIGIASKIGNGT